MLGFRHKHVAARIGYGYQEHPGEFLAMLAMARVPDDYPVRVGQDVRKVADLVEAEKLGCRSGGDSSLKLIGLAYYVADPEWKNDLGETWSIARMIETEIAQPIVTAPEGGLNRLMGLSYAVAHRARRGQPIEGQFRRAKDYLDKFHEYALRLQNADGSWGPYFFAAKAQSPDEASQLRSTGRVLEWLAMSLPEQKLADSRVSKRRRVRHPPGRQPALPVERAVAFHARDRLVGPRLARFGDLRPTGVQALRRRRKTRRRKATLGHREPRRHSSSARLR